VEPKFLTLEEVLEIHRDQIQRYGGAEGVGDPGLLESALGVPRSGAGKHYFHSDLIEMAAAYLFHIVRNHPFIDGNKRTGTAAALVFLKLNDIEVDVTNDALVEKVLFVAEGKLDKAAVAAFLRKHVPR